MTTGFMLLAFYGGRAVIPLDDVARDWFGHLSADKLQRKALSGEIDLPIIRIEPSQKAMRGVHLSDLADYIDRRRAAAVKEADQLRFR